MRSTHEGGTGDQSVGARRLFMVLSPRSLPYARLALESLYRNAVEPIDLALITDAAADKECLAEELAAIGERQRANGHAGTVYSAADLDELEEARFSRFARLRAFRRGHPCWRKITDPVLLSAEGQEMILLDPDLYFPSRFRFEPTPESGVLLMWQKPSCLFPPEVVEIAINAGIRMAHHVDIGVAHWRMPVDLEWLDWLIGQLGSPHLPRSMHVEAIVWAAVAMRIGGGHLDPRAWLCWHRSQYKRALRRLGAGGPAILRREHLAGIKCFHAGGEAKWWLAEAHKAGILDQDGDAMAPRAVRPFREFTPREFHGLQRTRRWLRRLGYYSLFGQEHEIRSRSGSSP